MCQYEIKKLTQENNELKRELELLKNTKPSWCITGVRKSIQTGHYNKEDDTRDSGEKIIDNTMEPYIKEGN